MMAGRLQSVELTVQHVRQPGQRMPVCRAKTFKSPDDTGPCQPGLDVLVFRYVLLVIISEELVGDGRQEKRKSDETKRQANPELATRVRSGNRHVQPFCKTTPSIQRKYGGRNVKTHDSRQLIFAATTVHDLDKHYLA